MINKTELIALLREGENYISGQSLCEHFQVSRNAIWKAINGLRAEGYEIEAISNKGYKLIETPDILSKEEILNKIRSQRIGRDLYYYASTDSTNTRIRLLAEEGAGDGTLAVADMQTAGRGRRGRTWISPSGMNIYMSLLLKPEIEVNQAPMVTLVMALAIAKGITQTTGLEAKIKWPNDIVVNGRKVCGILTEMNLEADYIRSVIVGIGINVNEASLEDFEEDIRTTASSLRIECGEIVNRAELIANSMLAFEEYYECFLKDRSLASLKDEYDSHLISVGKTVRVLDPKGEYEGISKGISENGELIVELGDGTITNVYAGEVSVRGLYGYAE